MPSLFYAGQPDYIEKLNTLATAASMTNGTVAASFLSLAVTGTATAASFVGPLTGNASTATTLATARNINGVAFNGSADITVAAAAGTLTGTTLAANVVNASISSIVPYGGAALYVGDGTQTQVAIVRGPGSGVNNGAAFIVQNGGVPVIALGNKSALVGGAYDATPLLYGNAPIEVNQSLSVTGSISATGGATINSITPAGGTLGVTGSFSATGNITSTGNVVQVGAAGAGTGGNFRITDDGGTLRWLAGLLGTAGARDWTLLEVVSGRTPIRANASTGAVSIDHGLTVTGLTTTDTLRVNVTPTAETPTATHTAVFNINGTNYKFLCLVA